MTKSEPITDGTFSLLLIFGYLELLLMTFNTLYDGQYAIDAHEMRGFADFNYFSRFKADLTF